MKPYVCRTLPENCRFAVSVPGSKSMTNRALLLGALAKGKTVLKGVLFSEDSRVFMQALKTIGYEIEIKEEEKMVIIEGLGGEIPGDGETMRRVYVGSAGTAARFLTAFLALSGKSFLMESSEQMKVRPMKPLLEALEALGVEFEYLDKPYAFPFQIGGKKEKHPERVELNIDQSSQFLSALLLSGVMCREGITIHLTGTRDAKAYVTISMKMMAEFGCETEQLDENTYRVMPGQQYKAGEYQIEPDVSAACYFYAIAAITGNEGKVMHVHSSTTQGDIRFLEVLEKMGCSRREEEDGIVVTGPSSGRLKGVRVKMTDFSDQTMTLAAIAPFADGDTVIDGVGHIRGQESDRIRGIVTELRRMGVCCEEREDGITIHPGVVKPCTIQTYEDHRMAMAFAVTGCRAAGIQIADPKCCKKTFENYFEVLTNLDLITNIE
ncbi:MAG: 3-phosphoshikimate 1-carboxyvinyltransferase [Roseburia sp.]|nr:3-phosphoshikimate 1-carboxyvinyltransferase [Roseburia sp.]